VNREFPHREVAFSGIGHVHMNFTLNEKIFCISSSQPCRFALWDFVSIRKSMKVKLSHHLIGSGGSACCCKGLHGRAAARRNAPKLLRATRVPSRNGDSGVYGG